MNDQSFFFLMQNAANTDTASTVSGRAVPASPVLGEEADFAVVEAVFEAVVDAAVVVAAGALSCEEYPTS